LGDKSRFQLWIGSGFCPFARINAQSLGSAQVTRDNLVRL
jgi:hypothetical protein